MFALIDCNNFYVSCERVFNPRLNGKPVLVLSSNDGCVISRSNEAKALGFKMGDPIFQKRNLVNRHRVMVYSSNFALYGDLSNRVMMILQGFSPDYEVYSIDEIFLGLNGFEDWDLIAYGQHIRETVLQGIKIPVSIGIAPTKTLAKVANFFAKRFAEYHSVCKIDDAEAAKPFLAQLDVQDIWGVGRRLGEALKKQRIHTALDLANADQQQIRQQYSVVLARTVLELQGVSCLDLCEVAPRKNILVSRSFGESVTEYAILREAVAHFATRAAEKLRGQHSHACAITVFIRTNPFNSTDRQYNNSITLKFATSTNSTVVIMKTAMDGLKAIFREGYKYKKAGTLLLDIIPPQHHDQLDFFSDLADKQQQERLMQAMDAINGKYGRNTIQLAVCGYDHTWAGLRQHISGAFTTSWDELLIVRAN